MNQTRLTFEYDSDESQRLDVFLASKIPDLTRSYIQTLIKEGFTKVNEEVIKKTGYKLDKLVKIEIVVPPPKPSSLTPESIPLEIVYEDSNFIVINKPAGMVVHPSAGHSSGTLVHAILAHAPDIQGIGGVQRPGIVHRLDKDTSGLILIAKNDRTHHYLQSLFKKRKISKTYLALVDSIPPTPTGRIEASIGRDSSHRQRMAIVPDMKGKPAISEYKTLETYKDHALLEVKILTGRTHQIRLHLAFLNCPIVGDQIYGRRNPTLPVSRQLLHAHKLEFIPPGSKTQKIFQAEIPEDFKTAISYLSKRGE